MPISREQEREERLARVWDLHSRGLKQAEIALELGWSQQQVSIDIRHLKSQKRFALSQHFRELPSQYDTVISNLEQIRTDVWKAVRATTSPRDKAVLYSVLINVNEKYLEVLSLNDIILANVENAEKLVEEAKANIKEAKEQILKAANEEQEEEALASGLRPSASDDDANDIESRVKRRVAVALATDASSSDSSRSSDSSSSEPQASDDNDNVDVDNDSNDGERSSSTS
jgi:predicted transcriptional regulator